MFKKKLNQQMQKCCHRFCSEACDSVEFGINCSPTGERKTRGSPKLSLGGEATRFRKVLEGVTSSLN